MVLYNKQQTDHSPHNTTNVLFRCSKELVFLEMKTPGFNDPPILYQMEVGEEFYI